MDILIEDFSLPLFLWQMFKFAVLIIVVFYIVKRLRRLYRTLL
jgi:hypothetical protein